MNLYLFGIYVIVINIIGFILFIINNLLYTYADKRQINELLTITSLIGGSFGILVAMFIFDRKIKKDNILLRIFASCVFVIELVIFLFLQGKHKMEITFEFWNIFYEHKSFLVYIIIINFISLILFVLDKFYAILNKPRIRIATLIGVCFIGGSVGGLLSMYIFRHKTKQNYFSIGIPLILIMHIVILLYLSNVI